MKSEKKKEHYVNNKEFLAAMVEYKKLVTEAEDAGEEKPPVTNYIGECFLKIANHLSYRPNFNNILCLYKKKTERKKTDKNQRKTYRRRWL